MGSTNGSDSRITRYACRRLFSRWCNLTYGRQEMETNIPTVGTKLLIVYALIPRKIDSRNIKETCRPSQFMWQGDEGFRVRVNTKILGSY